MNKQLTEEEYKDLVNRDIRDESTPDEAAWIRRPENLQRWHGTLVAAARKVEGQLSQRREAMTLMRQTRMKHRPGRDPETLTDEEFEAEIRDYHLRRMASLRFYASTQAKIIEAKNLMNGVKDFASAYNLLKTAIKIHREGFVGEDDIAEEDKALWYALDHIEESLV